MQQISLMALKLLSRHLAQKHPQQFKEIVETLLSIIKAHENVSRVVLATVVLCLAEICSNLRAQSISYLHVFMPSLILILEKQLETFNTPDNVLFSTITAVHKIVETLPLFLSPYLVDLIVCLSQIWSKIKLQSIPETMQVLFSNRLNAIWKKLATILSLRVLIPTINMSFDTLIAAERYGGIGPLMKLFGQSFENVSNSDIAPFIADLTTFFVGALQFRCNHPEMDVNTISAVETQIIEAFVALVFKLSEGSFRPIYNKIYDWALRDETESPDRAITFFR